MNQFAIQYFKQNGYAFFYNFPGPMAQPGYLEQGWKVVSPTENLFQAINPRRLASYELKNRFLGSVAGFLYDKFSNTRLKRLSSFSSILRIEVFDQFTDELKATDALRDKSGIDLVRSENYLRWRFDQHPKHSYKYVVVKKNDKLWGYAVVSTQNWLNGLMCGMIVDYLVNQSIRAAHYPNCGHSQSCHPCFAPGHLRGLDYHVAPGRSRRKSRRDGPLGNLAFSRRRSR